MGFPEHPTIEVPGRWPELATLVRAIPIDPSGARQELATALESGNAGQAGHVCATAWVLDASGTRVLLVDHPVLGWATPGGHVERGEEPGSTASRELHEETGLALRPEPDTPLVLHPAWFPDSSKGPGHWHHNIGYRFVGDPSVPLSPEPDAPVAWFPIAELPHPRVRDLDAVLAELR